MEEQNNAGDVSADDPRVIALTRRVMLEPNDSQRLSALCGPFDQNLKHLEKRLSVHIRNRGNEFQISGLQPRVEAAAALLHQLYRETYDREAIEPDFVHVLSAGRIVKTGYKDLAMELESRGYDWTREAASA